MKPWLTFLFFSFILGVTSSAFGQKKMKYDVFDEYPVYSSLETIAETPENVYRINLSGKYKGDSLPEVLFLCKNLKELVVSRCKLKAINIRIGELQHLVILDLSNNKLKELPDELTTLKNLSILNINRNEIDSLPENVGKMQSLGYLDAWDNPIYQLPISISKLKNVLKIVDLRQVAIKPNEQEAMEELLPKTKFYITSFCPCKN